jgi:hypothetical protein
MFITIFIISVVLVGTAFIGLGMQTFFSKKKTFPETRVGHNKALRKNKIYCISTQQAVLDKDYKQKKYIDPVCSDC